MSIIVTQRKYVFISGYIRVAKCCISLGDLRSAEAALERVLELDPAHGSNLINQEQASLAQLKKFQADTEQAYNVKDYRKVYPPCSNTEDWRGRNATMM